MAHKRYGADDILRLIHEIGVRCNNSMEVVIARLTEMKNLEKENQHLSTDLNDRRVALFSYICLKHESPASICSKE